jgi:hypothetical protein
MLLIMGSLVKLIVLRIMSIHLGTLTLIPKVIVGAGNASTSTTKRGA